MNATQSAILRALELAKILDTEHESADVHRAFRAVRHELQTLRGIHCPQATPAAPELASARTGRRTRPGSQRHLILGALSVAPAADFQLANHLRIDVQHVRRRRHELLAAGWVERSPSTTGRQVAKVRQEGTGRDCSVHQLTTAGYSALARLRSGQGVLFADHELNNDSVSTPDNVRGCDVRGTYESSEAITADPPGGES